MHKLTFPLALVFLLTTDDEMKTLESARRMFEDNVAISYDFKYTVQKAENNSGSCAFLKSNSFIGYDILIKFEDSDVLLINNVLKQVDYNEKKVILYNESQQKGLASNFIPVAFSPLLLAKRKLAFVQDTIFHNTLYANYKVVGNDSMSTSKKNRMEEHLFVDKTNFTIGRYEQRRVFNGTISKPLIFEYTNYKFSKTSRPLEYSFPAGFSTTMFGQSEVDPIQEGTSAPSFVSVDFVGKKFSLEAHRGRKVLLAFSIVNCGYCKSAFDHLLRKDFKLRDDIDIIYINPIDDKRTIELYLNKFKIPYTAIVDGSAVANLYRVSVFPTFYLIDSSGYIETRVVGYNKEFIDSLETN